MKQRAKNNSEKRVWLIFWRLFPQIMKAAPVLLWVEIVLSVCHGVSWGVETVMQQHFFDAAAGLAAGSIAWGQVFLSLGLLGCANVACQVLNGVANYLPSVLEGKAGGQLSEAIHRKAARLDPAVFEDTQKLDDINKAERGKQSAFWLVCDIIMIFAFYVPYFLFMGWYLFTLKPVLAAAILIVFFPTAFAQFIRSKVFSNLEDESAPVRREYEYYENCMVGREYFRETRLLGGFYFFKKLYLEALDHMQRLRCRAAMKSNLFELAMRVLTAAGYCAILLLLFDSLMKGQVSVGAFAAVFNSVGFLYSIMEEVICRHLVNIAQDIGTIRNYLNFLELDERAGQRDTAPGWGDIVLEHVSFSYPGGKKKAVEDVSFILKKGETLAVVGENGSGKSTLIRLICGLYLPDEGSVYMNGIKTGTLSTNALFSGTSAVFQKYQRYQMTLRENITVSGPGKACRDETLDHICRMAGTGQDENAFPDGYETMLSREFDGVDLSGGQWQRVAIARGFFREHHLIILDEPTAAIDPYEETRIYNQFAEISKDKSAVIVTHRIGSVKLADRIVVMKEGRAVQIGSHEKLIAEKGGEYRRLYESQQQWYQESVGTI